MKPSDLFNYKREEFETKESFAKRVYETARRYRRSLHFTPEESWHILTILARYYRESPSEILSAVRYVELNHPSKKYLIQWVQCLGKHYLVIDRRSI